MLIQHMEQGLSFDTFAGLIGVCRDSLYEWVRKYKDFSYAKSIATAKRNYKVESMYAHAAQGKPFPYKDPDGKKRLAYANQAMMIYWTKNTLGWTDKVEHSANAESPPAFTLNYKLDE